MISYSGFDALIESCRKLSFEPHDIAQQLDSRGHYKVELEEEFPFLIKLFRYTSRRHTRGATWHERLELFTPLDGPALLRVGEEQFSLEQGDVLVVDNLKLHNVLDFPGFNTRVIVISFLPEFVYSLGSPSHDYAFLLPFYSKLNRKANIIRLADDGACEVYEAMRRLVECFFGKKSRRFYQAGCKVYLLEMLYHMARQLYPSEMMEWEFVRQQQRSLRLKKLFDHISRHYADRLSVAEASRIVGMSQPQFMKTFKKVSGTTLVAYLHRVRLSNGARLLKETDLSIGEIASRVGFSDQSYFDKRFKRSFGQSPKDYRSGLCRAALPV